MAVSSPGCPSDEQVARFRAGELAGDEREQLVAHVESCASCRARLGGGTAVATEDFSTTPSPGRRPAPARGTVVGRYVVLGPVGIGGTATVCAAYDPELDRRVAVKLLHLDALHEPLIAREAQILAKLNHPNVATVYDVGSHDGKRFLAMELAPGSLRDWLVEPRPVAQIVSMLAAAGDGLVAAHRAGVVHGDFKPENVLLGDDGRPRVSDFGLARRVGERDGRVGGTPRYMALEQFDNAPAGPPADTFAFAVTLYEALYRVPPYAGDTRPELAASIRRGALRVPPTDRAVPAWLHRLIVSALVADPAARPELADVVARLRAPRRRRWIAAAAAAVAAAIVASVATAQLTASPAAPAVAAPPSCEDSAAAALAGVWDGARHAAVAERFTASGAPAAATVLASTTAMLDRYATTWSAMAIGSCRETRVERIQPEETMVLRASCLADRRRELRAWTDVLARADAGVVAHALDGTAQLADVAICGDVATLAGPLPRPRDPATVARLDAALADIDAAEAAVRAGTLDDALHARALAALAAVRATGHAPSAAYAANVVADCERGRGDVNAAIARSTEAAADAQRGHDDFQLLHALDAGAEILGMIAGRPDEALRYVQLAAATAERLGDPPDDLIEVESTRASVYAAMGRLDEALADRRDIADRIAAQSGPDSLSLLESRTNLATTLTAQGKLDEALAIFRDVVPRLQKVYGDGNPETLPALGDLGQVLLMAGHVDEAAPILEAMPAAFATAYGSDSPYTANVWVNLGELRIARGQFADALVVEARAVAILEAGSRDNPGLAEPLTQIGLALTALHRPAEALAPLERALVIASASATATDAAPTQLALARALVAAGGDRARAGKLADAARAAWRAAAAKWGGQNATLADAATL
nr:serine/threonine-protein kinase [Kofleriaceae bacterium]